jgi:hypothetical protein
MLLPLLVSAASGAILVGDRLARDHELRVIAPDEAIAGGPLPVRAVLFPDLRHEVEVPRAVSIDAFLEAPGGEVGPRVRLRPSRVLGSEGELALPRGATSELRVVVEARAPGGSTVRASRRVRVRPDAAKPRRRPRAADLERLWLGPLEPAGGVEDHRRLDLALPSGACVPELPCRLSVRVGAPPARLAIEPVAGVEVLGVGPEPSPTAGLVEVEVVVRGPEARLDLVATREGREVARRRARLPLWPGGVAVDVARPAVSAGEDPGVVVRLLDPRPLAVDLFRDGRWIAALSVDAIDGATHVPLPPLAPGLHRVQVSRYPFTPGAEDEAGVGLFRVGGATTPEAAARRGLAPLARTRIDVPEPASIDPAVRAAAARSRRRLRLLGALICAFAGSAASFLLVRRGLAAEREVAALGAPAEGEPLEPAGPSVEVLVYGALLFLAFASVGALLAVYGR